MASKELLCFLFVCFFASESATCYTNDGDCSYSESCCTDNVCREDCYFCSSDSQFASNEQSFKSNCVRFWSTCSCSYDSKCDSGEQCSNGKCISSSSLCSCSYKYQCGIGKDCWGGNVSVALWLERCYCRRYYLYNYIIWHRHFHRILLLLCFLSVLPLSYTRYCVRNGLTAGTANALSAHDDDAASTSSSADELQPASSGFRSGSSTLSRVSTATKPISSTANTSSSCANASCSKC